MTTMTLDLTSDVVALTEAVVNMESVSLDEQALADATSRRDPRSRTSR